MNKHKAVIGLMRIKSFLQKLEPLMSPTIEASIQALDQVIEWLNTVEVS